jgi:hypothetical protein
MDDTTSSISHFLRLREWKQALFTTYTLSLSYFESEVLPSLLRVGCSDIWLVADAEGYRSSLLERRSMRVGHEYHLIPVALQNGVFHAKSIYLSSDAGDLLLVGSGNVTFAGHGRNLEVFEALASDEHSDVFGEFAAYLEALRNRDDITFARTDWIDVFVDRARLASGAAKPHSGLKRRLVHSLNEPIIEQLPGLLSDRGTCTAVTVMSPYHDPDGLSLSRLSEVMGEAPVSVSVPPANPEKSPFPFAATSSWPVPASPVRLATADKRFAHAKLYEFSYKNGLAVLTGSINATRKALLTVENVELGVLSTLPEGSKFLDWKPAKQPSFEPQSRMPSGLNENEIVYAAFDRNDSNLLTGQIISLRETYGIWTGTIIQADGDAASFDVLVGNDGRFDHTDVAFEHFAELPALQIFMILGDREARGWVHNEMFLGMPARRRLTAGALRRLMRREGSDDDIDALLDYLSIHAENHLRLFDLPIRDETPAETDGGSPQAVITVSLGDIAPIAGNQDGGSGFQGLPDQRDRFDVAMERLRRAFLGHGRSKAISVSSYADTIIADDETDIGGPTGKGNRPEADKRSLESFESHMARLIEDARGTPASVRALLVLTLEVGMSMRIYRFNDLNAAYEFLQSWFFEACRLVKPDLNKVSSLEQHVITSAATLFALAAGKDHEESVAVRLHDSLEHFYEGEVNLERSEGALLASNNIGFGSFLIGDQASKSLYSDSLVSILARPTIRKQLIEALALAGAGQQIPSSWEVFQSAPGADLLVALQNEDCMKDVRAEKRKSGACAFDYYSFSVDSAAKYERYRIGQCIHCKRFTLDISP